MLWAINPVTGALIWNQTLSLSAGSLSSPAVVGGRVYVGGASGMYAFDEVTGALVWNNTGGLTWRYHALSSPAVADGRVYVGHLAGIKAYDADTGAVLWNQTIGGRTDYHPSVANGVVYAVAVGTNKLLAYDASTGTNIWNYTPLTVATGYSSVAIANGRLYLSGGNESNSELIALGPAAPNSTCAGAPVVSLDEPAYGTNVTSGTNTFSYVPYDDSGFSSATLYANFSGTFRAITANTSSVTNGATNYLSAIVPAGYFVWNVRACDDLGSCAFAAANFTLNATSTNVTVCGVVYTQPGTYVLEVNLSEDAGPILPDESACITLDAGAANSTLDCRGNTVIGNAGPQHGILLNNTANVLVNNCSATGWDRGLYSNQSNNVTILYGNFYNNQINMYFNPTNDSNVYDTYLATASSTNLIVNRSHRNTFRRIHILDGWSVGAYYSDDLTVADSDILTPYSNTGVYIEGGNRANFSNNYHTNNTYVYQLIDANGTTLRGNTANGTVVYHAWLKSSNYTSILYNNFTKDAGIGANAIYFDVNNHNNLIHGNEIRVHYGVWAINFYASNGSTISNNTVYNAQNGIILTLNSDGNTISGNTFIAPTTIGFADRAIEASGGSRGNLITGNTINSTVNFTFAAVQITANDTNTLTNNVINIPGGAAIIAYEDSQGGGNTCPIGTCYQHCIYPNPLGTCPVTICTAAVTATNPSADCA
jgi:parallel beta-helix repeat protein